MSPTEEENPWSSGTFALWGWTRVSVRRWRMHRRSLRKFQRARLEEPLAGGPTFV